MLDVDTTSLYSVRQVADRLGVHPETVRRLIHDGRLQAVRVGRVLRIAGRLRRLPLPPAGQAPALIAAYFFRPANGGIKPAELKGTAKRSPS